MAMVTERVEVRPPWAFRLRRQGGMDGVLRRRGRALQRLLHLDSEPVVVGVAEQADGRVSFAARGRTRDAARWGIERMRFATGVDDDLREFHERFRSDPLIGPAVRRDPAYRMRRRPLAWESFAWAVTEQLIELERAAQIQKQIVRAGPRCPETGLRDMPSAAAVAALSPARLESWGLSAGRSLTLRRAAREIAAGRIDLEGPDHETAWRRLGAIPGIGRWTIEMTALTGQGRYDQLPAGDLGYLKLAGPLLHGRPRARATEDEVRELFAPYDEWKGLAGAYLGPALALRGQASQFWVRAA